VIQSEDVFQSYFTGEREPEPRGDLFVYYKHVFALTNTLDIPPEERARWEQRRLVTVRLRFYRFVAEHLIEEKEMPILAGYSAAGLPVPDYATEKRAAALDHIRELRAANCGAAAEALGLLERGLRDLDPAVIPANWTAGESAE
jgi:hypothetical protein